MWKEGTDRCVFPLTSLQIGDLQSYLSDLSLFLAFESKKFYVLVDNRPWLNFSSKPTQLWQLMVTKSRLSPFANTKARRQGKEGKEVLPKLETGRTKKLEKWSALIDAATLSHKRVLLPVKKLRNSLLLSSELHRILFGFIVFEVEWDNVRGINYLNELQTDTSLAIEAKFMKRWEFDSIAQAVTCMSSWFSGTHAERLMLKEHLNDSIGEVFYDAKDELPKSKFSSHEESHCDDPSTWGNSPKNVSDSFATSSANRDDRAGEPHTPPLKRRRVTRSFSNGDEAYFSSDEKQYEDPTGSSAIGCETTTVDSFKYRDVLIISKFNDHDLPFALKQVIMSNLRLLTLLESGLPSWVIFLQSYPVFCHIYRPWMCPLARALYVVISVVTVLIGFYDLYKNVPVLKATAAHLCGPLFDWIETWEMVSRIKYLGTMLFLHNCEKAVKWFLMMTRTTRSFFSVLSQPFVQPFLALLECLLPLWNVLSETVTSSFSTVCFAVGSSCRLVAELVEILLQPLWFLLSVVWNIGSTILYPIVWTVWEVLYLPIRVVLGLADSVAFVWICIYESGLEVWGAISSMFRVASATNTAVSSTYEVSKWRSLWNDLFSQVFRALRTILNGFVAFFAACNRHRLSIYNHTQVVIHRLSGKPPRSEYMDRTRTRTHHKPPPTKRSQLKERKSHVN